MITLLIAFLFAITPHAYAATGLCYNFGYEPLVNGQYDMTQVAADLTFLKSKGVTCIRTADYGTNSPLSEGLALYAKQQGFYVQIGNDAGTLTSKTLAAYDTGVVAEAKWAQTHGINEVSLGNEQENRLSGISKSQWISHVKQLATKVRAVYAGKISYSTSGDFTQNWINAGSLGAIDLFAENDYCGHGCNQNFIQIAVNKWGINHVEVSETNCDIEFVPSCGTDAGLATEMQGDVLALHAQFPTIPMYVFAWKSGGDGTPTYWGVAGRPAVLSALGL